MKQLYDKVAGRYDRMHGRWLRHAGGEAQAALEAGLMTRIQPGMRVLDAGCGTGALARSLRSRFDATVSLTLLDASRAMLARTADIPARRVHGSLLALPFPAGAFDIAVAAWAIEATGDELTAVRELMRVVRPGGHVIVAFCASVRVDRMAVQVLRKGVEWRGTGRFVDADAIDIAFRQNGADHVMRHRCSGPAAVMDAQRAETVDLAQAA